MGLRYLMSILLFGSITVIAITAAGIRTRRQSEGQPSDTFYQPPILLGAPQVVLQNSYQPPLPKPRSAPSPAIDSAPSAYVPPYALPIQSADSYQPSISVHSSNSGLSAERTYSTNAVGSAIHKTPASEIQPNKEPIAAEKDSSNNKDEYVVYYYYYYDNDTSANNNNLSLNFDDIPSLEGYDDAPKEIVKSVGNAVDNANSSSQARSLSGNEAGVIRADRPLVQPLKPVSNVFRYGSNEVPRFPVLPNFVVSEVTTTTEESLTLAPTSDQPTTTIGSQFPRLNEDSDDDSLNNVLDSTIDQKTDVLKAAAEETTTSTTTMEPTTTEIATTTTTTEKPRRRPSIGGGSRRRFNPSPSSSFASNRNRSPTRGSATSSPSSTSSSSTTSTAAPTRRSFQGSRLRPRPGLGGSRTVSRTTESSDDKPVARESSSSSSITTTTPSATTARSRFTSGSPRRFQSSRSRSQTSSTTSTTRSPSAPSARSRTTSRPRPSLISRNRPARPGFLRPRPGSEPEEPETTTPEAAPEETTPSNEPSVVTGDDSEEESEEEASTEEPEEQTTTESSRFSALFRPRNRNALGNRPRPVIGNRPSRS